MGGNCGDCMYGKKIDWCNGQFKYFCNRYAPRESKHGFPSFPTVHEDCWCGDWRNLEAEKPIRTKK